MNPFSKLKTARSPTVFTSPNGALKLCVDNRFLPAINLARTTAPPPSPPHLAKLIAPKGFNARFQSLKMDPGAYFPYNHLSNTQSRAHTQLPEHRS